MKGKAQGAALSHPGKQPYRLNGILQQLGRIFQEMDDYDNFKRFFEKSWMTVRKISIKS